MKKQIGLPRLLSPLIVMILFGCLVMAQTQGLFLPAKAPVLELIPETEDSVKGISADQPMLVVRDAGNRAEETLVQSMTDTLDVMRIPWTAVDIGDSAPPLEGVQTMLVCTASPLVSLYDAESLMKWANEGGRIAFCTAPELSGEAAELYRLMGISWCAEAYQPCRGYQWTTDLLPVMQAVEFKSGWEIGDEALSVRLASRCVVHLKAVGEEAFPLLWSRQYGRGRVAVLGGKYMGSWTGLGFSFAVLAALEETLVYPVVNAGVIYLEDFPMAAEAELDTESQSFLLRRWWPDMRRLAWKYQLIYTGIARDSGEGVNSYFAAELVHLGGELRQGYTEARFPYATEGFQAGVNGWRQLLAGELALYGSFSHQLSWSDALWDENTEIFPWEDQAENFRTTLEEIAELYPQLRFVTATEGAAAAQRSERLSVTRTMTDDALELQLEGLADTAWLALRTNRTPKEVIGGQLYPVEGALYWIEAQAEAIRIEWE